MLRPDVQAELLLDFQEERTRTIQKSHRIESEMPVAPTYRSRFLLAMGTFMVGLGKSLQRSAGCSAASTVKATS